MKKVFLHCPTYSAQLCTSAANGVRVLEQALRQRGDVLHIHEVSGDSLVTRARDTLWTQFMLTDCTHQFFLDDDIGFNPYDVLRMLDSGLDFVCGAYPIKDDSRERYCVNLHPDQTKNPEPHYRRVSTTGTGFMLMSRAACERVMDHLQPRVYRHNGNDVRGNFFVFQIGPDGKNWFRSEDYYVCDAYCQAGGEIFVDTRIKLTHMGTKVWKGDFGAFLERKEQEKNANINVASG